MKPGRSTVVARLSAIIATGLIVVGCGEARNGIAQPEDRTTYSPTTSSAKPAPTSGYDWLTAVLPSNEELTTAAGFQLTMDKPPSVSTRLRDTITGSQLTEGQCLGVVSPLETKIYGGAPVRAVTFATESTITIGAVALASVDDARRLFDTFVTQWRSCQGMTFVKADRIHTYEHRISQVDATQDVVSAIVEVVPTSPTAVPVRSQRAVGVAEDCIVEASIPITDTNPNDPPPTTDAAVGLVNAMLAKVRAIRP